MLQYHKEPQGQYCAGSETVKQDWQNITKKSSLGEHGGSFFTISKSHPVIPAKVHYILNIGSRE